MRGILYDGTEELKYCENLEIPVPAKNQSLILILYSGVCNTDKEVMKGYRPEFRGIMGHEFVGVVEESENAALVGKRVVGEINAGCGHCVYCRTGREKHCQNRKVLGMHGRDGCFAEYMVLENDLLHIVPESLPSETAVFVEPLAAALEIPSQVHMKPFQNAAVLGDGRLAYMCAQVLALSGADLTVIGKHTEKLEQFKQIANVRLLSEIEEEMDNQEAALSGESCYEVVVEATGSPSGIAMAQKLVRKQGTIVLKSTYADTTKMDMSSLVVNEITLTGSRCGPFRPALNLLDKGMIRLPEIELYDLKEYKKAFQSKAFKAGFRL